MIRVGVGQDDRSDRRPPARAELWRQDARAHVDRTADESPTVHDDRLPVRQVDDRPVSLADIEERGTEHPARRPGAARGDLEQRQRPCGESDEQRAVRRPKRDRPERGSEDHELP